MVVGRFPDPVTEPERFWDPNVTFPFTKIKPKVGGSLIPFHLWSHQEILAAAVLRCYAESKWIVHVKPRKEGSSTFFACVMAQLACFTRGTRVGILAHKRPVAAQLTKMAMRFHATLPEHVRPRKSRGQKVRLELPDLDSGIDWAGAQDDEPFRGDTIQNLLATEVSSYSAIGGPDLWASVLNSLPDEGFVIAESTPKHYMDELHLIYREAQEPNSKWIPVFVPWTSVRECQATPPPSWRPRAEVLDYANRYHLSVEQAFWMQTVGLTKTRQRLDKFKAEYPIHEDDCWIQSGDAIFDVDRLIEMRRAIDGYTGLNTTHEELETYVPPLLGHRYLIFCDPASGEVRHDLFGIEVLDVDACEQVAEFHGHKEAYLIAKLLAELHTKYNGARVYVEANGVGEGLITALLAMGLRQELYHRKVSETKRAAGWYSSEGKRLEALDAGQEIVKDGSVTLHSVRLIKQLIAYRGKGKQRDGDGGHFDLASAFAGAAWAWRHERRARRVAVAATEAVPTVNWKHILSRSFGAKAPTSRWGRHS